MGNHILTALVQRKSQLWKELEAIEAFENAMAQNNTDAFTAVPEAKPKRAVQPVQRKPMRLVQMDKMHKVKNIIDKTLHKIMEKVYHDAGGYEYFNELEKHAAGRRYITLSKTNNYLRAMDYSDSKGKNEVKLCSVPRNYTCEIAREALIQIHEATKILNPLSKTF
jgi:hypothetical protein